MGGDENDEKKNETGTPGATEGTAEVAAAETANPSDEGASEKPEAEGDGSEKTNEEPGAPTE